MPSPLIHQQSRHSDLAKIQALQDRVVELEDILKWLVKHDDPSVHHLACKALNLDPSQA